ncbi:IspD/TarI family cytidylyltransferase [Amycolatopsis lurida]
MKPHAAAVVLASGSGTRVGAEVNKVYLPLAGRRLVSWSLGSFARTPGIGVLVLVARPQDQDLVEWVLDREVDGAVEVVYGGRSRQESELRALRHLSERIDDGTVDAVLLHDAARPLVSPELIAAVLQAARRHGGALPGLTADDILSVEPETGSLEVLPPGTAIRAQTPQAFHARPLIEAYEEAARQGFEGTDTSSVMEQFSAVPTHWVAGEHENFKVTYAHDLLLAEKVVASGKYRR